MRGCIKNIQSQQVPVEFRLFQMNVHGSYGRNIDNIHEVMHNRPGALCETINELCLNQI